MSNPWSSKEPLSNAEFRKLLETPLPRSHRRHEGKKGKSNHTHHRGDGDRHKRAPQKPPLTEEEKKNREDKSYRDRARERREGKNPDYEPLLPEMQAILQGKGLGNDIAHLTMEDSKFLGGDLEHTHLVKGLDYALLQKERAKMEKEQEALEKVKALQLKIEDLTFKTSAGRAVYKAIFEPQQSHSKDFFAPRRTAFVYSTSEDSSSMPTIWRRPRAECPTVEESIMGNLDANCLQDIAKIMAYLRPTVTGKPQKKIKKKEMLKMLEGVGGNRLQQPPNQVQSAQPSMPSEKTEEPKPEPEVDIFGDAGSDYKFNSRKKNKDAKPKKGNTRSYFRDGKDDMSDLPPPAMEKDASSRAPDSIRVPSGSSINPAGEPEGPGRAMEKAIANETDPGAFPDHYAECYPGYHQSVATYISDDEDYSQMDTRGKRLSRYQFDTEEEWQRAQEHQEAMPKAAFQFGVKMSDGRKTHKDLESRRKDQKLETQLNKIERLMKEKGHEHETAFRAGEIVEEVVPAGRSRKRLKV